ncbi:hypothetical protein M0R89_14450 [Halorussus limi]|uniref:Uncharacterized protein n=1 Tax=Halorussus limi TaxID=2938695 RepID=A0A8U0HST5_9EURY|nr:hypothetical protein [Halorussus limi]UPV73734.1 hypothetical protein M0R89_14450 [Halorussus limi]
MSLSARDALEYATRDAYLKLYAVLAGGFVLMFAGQFVFATAVGSLLALLGLLGIFTGLLGVLAATVAVLHKILAES